MTFVRDWLRNLLVYFLVLLGVAVFMLIFLQIFYPQTLGFLWLALQGTFELIAALKWWPMVVLAVMAGVLSSTMPRRRGRGRQNGPAK